VEYFKKLWYKFLKAKEGQTIDIDKLVLERVIFEIRYTHGYLYWDNCGKIWRELSLKWPNIKLDEVDTSKARLTLSKDETPIGLGFSPNKADTTQDYPRRLNTYVEFTSDAIQNICKYLEIDSFTRVGNRFHYIYPVKEISEAFSLVSQTGMVDLKEEKLKLFGKEPRGLTLKFTVHGKDMGYNVALSALSRELNIEVFTPYRTKIETPWFVDKCLLIDIDRFTLNPVPLDALKCDEFILSTEREIKKTILNLF